MRGTFDYEEEQERRGSGGDTELTLGTGTFLFLCAGLVVLCGFCFGLGYLVGHRGSASQAALLPTAGTPAISQPGASQAKPSATTQAPTPATAPATLSGGDASQPAAVGPPQSTTAVTVPVSPTQNGAPSGAQPQVRPALPPSATPAQTVAYPSHPTDRASQSQIRPAGASQAASFWVQVAAVSHVEDARALTNALIKRGYAVTARRDADDLIHVRIGPFNSRGEANNWRLKLLNDGYNAEIQQQ